MPNHPTQNCPRPRVGVKPPPGGAVGGCSCKLHEQVCDAEEDRL